MRPKGMENLAAFSFREMKRAAARKEKETNILLQKDSKSRNKRQSHAKELS